MVPFETDAAQRKETSYKDLVHRAKQAGYNTHSSTIEVDPTHGTASAGSNKNDLPGFSLLSHVPHNAIEGSFSIWCSRNRVT